MTLSSLFHQIKWKEMETGLRVQRVAFQFSDAFYWCCVHLIFEPHFSRLQTRIMATITPTERVF